MDVTHSGENRESTELPELDEIQLAPIAPEVSGAPGLPHPETATEALDQQLGAAPPADTDDDQQP